MCISVSLSGFVVLGCMFAPKVHIIMFQPQKNVTSHRHNPGRFSVSGPGTTYSHGEPRPQYQPTATHAFSQYTRITFLNTVKCSALNCIWIQQGPYVIVDLYYI